MMTEIAAIFHWSYNDMAAMDLSELALWNKQAVEWFHRVNGQKG